MKQIKIVFLSVLCWGALQASQQSFIEKIDQYFGEGWNIAIMNVAPIFFEERADSWNKENRHFIIQEHLIVQELLLELESLKNTLAMPNGYTIQNAIEFAKIGLKLNDRLQKMFKPNKREYRLNEERRMKLIDALMELHKDFPSAKIF